jgi:hypothetical protein
MMRASKAQASPPQGSKKLATAILHFIFRFHLFGDQVNRAAGAMH